MRYVFLLILMMGSTLLPASAAGKTAPSKAAGQAREFTLSGFTLQHDDAGLAAVSHLTTVAGQYRLQTPPCFLPASSLSCAYGHVLEAVSRHGGKTSFSKDYLSHIHPSHHFW